MEIRLTIEQETQLSQIASLEGKGADELAREVLIDGLALKAAQRATLLPQHLDLAAHTLEAEAIVARILELRKGNLLPDGVSICALIREGRA